MKTLYKMLRAKRHQDIIKIIDTVSQEFHKYQSAKWTLYVPKIQTTEFRPLFASHTDTVSDNKPKELKKVNGILKNPNGVLGADDRAGCYGLYQMMQNGTEGYYLFTDEEEIGGIGAGEFAESDLFETLTPHISCLIELDRKGAKEIALYEYDNEEFIGLFEQLGYKREYGSYTDVVDLAMKSGIACMNLSIGYYNEHTKHEMLDISEMNGTIEMMLTKLPTALYQKQFEVEAVEYPSYSSKAGYSWDIEPICCELCEQHLPLFDTLYGSVCAECLSMT